MTRAQLEEIANAKMPDLTAADLDAAVRTIAGSARSHGPGRGGRGLMGKQSQTRRRPSGSGSERSRLYSADEAFTLLKELSSVKFTENVDVAVNLGVDPRKSDQVVRGSTVLPHGIGKEVRVAVFAQGADCRGGSRRRGGRGRHGRPGRRRQGRKSGL